MARDAQSRLETIGRNSWTVHYVIWTGGGNNTDGAKVGIHRLDLDCPQGTSGPLSVWFVFDQ